MFERHISLLKNTLEVLREPAAESLISKFDWTNFRPDRGDQFYPQAWVQSLDDTPEIFLDSQIKKFQLRSEVKKYLRRKNGHKDVPSRNWTKDGVRDLVKVDDLLYLSLFDISLDSEDMFEVARTAGRSRPIPHKYTEGNDSEDNYLWAATSDLDRSQRSDADHGPSLWSRFLDNCVSEYSAFDKLHPNAQNALKDPGTRKEILKKYHNALLDILNDSVG